MTAGPTLTLSPAWDSEVQVLVGRVRGLVAVPGAVPGTHWLLICGVHFPLVASARCPQHPFPTRSVHSAPAVQLPSLGTASPWLLPQVQLAILGHFPEALG